MCAVTKDEKPNLILSIFRNKCPRCRRGNMFQESNPYKLKSFMRMNERCPVCGQPLEMEPGFYYGTNMVSYALAILFSGFSFILWWLPLDSLQKMPAFSGGWESMLFYLLFCNHHSCDFPVLYGSYFLFLTVPTGEKAIL
jgi:uncharacterized protein (DUF983 family)